MRRPGVLLGVLGVIVVTVLWFLFFLSPRNDDIEQAEQALASAQDQEQILRTQIANLEDISEQQFSYQVAIQEMEASIPIDPELDAFIEDLTFLAERSGVDLVAVAANPPAPVIAEDAADFFEVEVTLALEGQFFELLGFLYGLEEMERLVRVDNMALNPSAVPEAETTTTTTTTAAPGDTTSTSSTTTTTIVDDERLRPEPGLLSINLTATLFTRTPIVAPTPDTTVATTQPPQEEEGS